MANFIYVNERSSLREKIVSAIAITIIVLIALSVKKPDAIFHPQLWAEDGVIFLAQQRELGFFNALTTQYAGYYHLVPRVVALGAACFPLIYTPVIYNYVAIFMTCFVSLYIYFSNIELKNRYLRVIISLVPIIVPHGGEVFINITNIQWILAMILPFLYLGDMHESWKEIIFSLILILVVGLTGPFMMITSLAILIRIFYIKRINLYETIFYFSIFIVSLIQAPCIFHECYSYETVYYSFPFLMKKIFNNFFVYFYFGNILPSYFLKTLFIISTIIVLLSFTSMLKLQRLYGYYIFTSICIAVLIFFATMLKIMHSPALIMPYSAGDRYYYIPYGCMFVVYIFLAAAEEEWKKLFGTFVLALILLSSATVFTKWTPLADLQWRAHIKEFSHKEKIVVPINPPGWQVELTRKPGEETQYQK